MYKEIKKCRVCSNKNLVSIINLGNQALTGIFPRTKDQEISFGPLELVKCLENRDDGCGLLQLRHSYNPKELFGENYGYRSGINKSMVEHLQDKVKEIVDFMPLVPGDIILDIGSNDSTLLQAYPKDEYILVGIDPAGNKFRKYYPEHIQLIPDFFCADYIKRNFKGKKVKIVTSIAMFYDLESPMEFMKQIYDILDDEGVWVFEQNYMPIMLEMNSYDTICHEHLEYYRLKQVKWMTDRVGFKIIDIELNDVNGGSFLVVVAKIGSSFDENTSLVEKILFEEESKGLNTLRPYEAFKQRVYKHRNQLRKAIQDIKIDNKVIIGYGASTKGNVILQFCGFTQEDIPFIAEINEDKFGCYTPGTYIPIISEEAAKIIDANYLFILPWYFKDYFLKKERKYLEDGGNLLIPLSEIEIISKRCPDVSLSRRKI